MTTPSNQYSEHIAQLEAQKTEKELAHTVYLSRRAIWLSSLLAFLTYLAPYIYTRRWKPLGIFTVLMLAFFTVFPVGESFEESFEAGAAMSPFASLIAAIDNGLAINEAKKKVKS